jgi:hypothetical protein
VALTDHSASFPGSTVAVVLALANTVAAFEVKNTVTV